LVKVATFNINNINKRLDNLLAWLAKAEPDEFDRHEEERTRRIILRGFSVGKSRVLPDLSQVIEAMRERGSREPGSITMKTSRGKRTTIVLGEDLLAAMDAQKELTLLG
jgi:hypothetical protein